MEQCKNFELGKQHDGKGGNHMPHIAITQTTTIIGIIIAVLFLFVVWKRNHRVKVQIHNGNIKTYKQKWYWKVNQDVIRVMAFAGGICLIAIGLSVGLITMLIKLGD